MRDDRRSYMDCARALCMVYIVGFWHLLDYVELDTGGHKICVTYHMTYGVLATFTFISGYFLGTKKVSNVKDVLSFYARRLIAFYPLYVVACAALFYMGYIVDFQQFVFTIVGISGVISPAVMTVWYMCMLMLFYFVTPFINCFDRNKWKFIIIAFIDIGLILLSHVAMVDERYSFYFIFYGAGILLQEKTFGKVNVILLFLSIMLFVILSVYIGTEITILSFVPAACFVFFIINLGKYLETLPVLIMFNKISYLSMSAYLFHRPIYSIISHISRIYMGNLTLVSAYCAALPAVMFFSYSIQYLYDRFVKCNLLAMAAKIGDK